MQVLTSMNFVAVAVGAVAGAWLRWGLGLWLNRHEATLPWGTFAANMLGGYLVGLVLGMVAAHPEWPPFWRLLLVTGFLGALTTFSTFSAETIAFIEEGRFGMAVSYSGLSLAGSLLLTYLGLLTAHSLRA
ncbi:fluoride efflux transporter CrcB [Zwartia sp.]|uniref:fluoride efflux transporter CrcB n=1 Tax=Zwartia sp. TaxID=2978004 RepID=UPI0027242D44|nr:fluoride efflux transporter CrcB [Zwartia sp.]MDO9023379.1 fluoride efflux transporter CrcB [Zwartia sp.]